MPDITGGDTFINGNKVVGVSDAEMAKVQILIKAGVGLPGPMSDSAMRAVLALQGAGNDRPKRYNNLLRVMGDAYKSDDPNVVAEVQAANAAFVGRVMNASPGVASVHTDSALANMSTQYANEEFIGELLMPPVQVSKKSDIYYTYGKRDRLTQPVSDLIAEDGEAADVVESRSTGSYACVDRGLKRGVAANAVANQDAPLDEMFDLTASLLDHRGLARERRIATVVTTATNYVAANRATLAGVDQWNAAGGGDPIGVMQTADAALWRGIAPAQSIAATSLSVYNVLSRHEDFLGLFQYGGEKTGLATPDMIAKYLGWDRLLIGRGWYDSTPIAAAATYARIWGNYFVLLRVANRQTVRSATFGMTIRWTMPGVQGANGGIVTQQWFDPTKGLGGTYFAKVGESECHEVQSNDCGYHVTSPIA